MWCFEVCEDRHALFDHFRSANTEHVDASCILIVSIVSSILLSRLPQSTISQATDRWMKGCKFMFHPKPVQIKYQPFRIT